MAAAAALTTTPEITVSVSGALRALWAARKRPAEPGPAPGPTRPTGQGRVRLRRDGARPLVFDGSVLATRSCEATSGAGPISLGLAIYLGPAGAVVGAVAARFHNAARCRPVHHAAPIAGGGDLVGLLETFAEDLGDQFAWAEAGPATDARRLVARLVPGFTNPSIATSIESEDTDDLHD